MRSHLVLCVIGILLTVSLPYVYKTIQQETRRFQALLSVCETDRMVYKFYVGSDICTTPFYRLELEYRSMVKCREIEKLLNVETPVDCAVNMWIQEGPIGWTVYHGIYRPLQAMSMYLYTSVILVCFLAAICGCRVIRTPMKSIDMAHR